MPKIDFSIILPCHNEAGILEDSVLRIADVCKKVKLNFEIIIMEDGSTDDTKEIGEKLAKKHKFIRFYHHDFKLGRGRAVMEGIKKSHGFAAGFIDADLQTPPEFLINCYNLIKEGNGAVQPLRYYKDFFNKRAFLSVCYRKLFKRLLRTTIEDPAVGCKFFNKEKILKISPKIKDTKWFWDSEVILISQYEGLKVKEFPSYFLDTYNKENRKSKARIFKDTIELFTGMLKLRSRIKREYPEDFRKGKWKN